MSIQETKDANFFGMIHDLLEQQASEEGERRTQERRRYQCHQLLASYDGKTPPGPTAFRPVLCHDLSPNGFSFYLPRRPDYKYVIVALGQVPFAFFSAEVVRCQELDDSYDEPFLVGCRFIGRLTAK